jgi:hypothetical protein
MLVVFWTKSGGEPPHSKARFARNCREVGGLRRRDSAARIRGLFHCDVWVTRLTPGCYLLRACYAHHECYHALSATHAVKCYSRGEMLLTR